MSEWSILTTFRTERGHRQPNHLCCPFLFSRDPSPWQESPFTATASPDPPVPGQLGHRPRPGWRWVLKQQLMQHSGELLLLHWRSVLVVSFLWCSLLFSFDRGALWNSSHSHSMRIGSGTDWGTSLPGRSQLRSPSPWGVPREMYPLMPSPREGSKRWLEMWGRRPPPPLPCPSDASVECFEAAERSAIFYYSWQNLLPEDEDTSSDC